MAAASDDLEVVVAYFKELSWGGRGNSPEIQSQDRLWTSGDVNAKPPEYEASVQTHNCEVFKCTYE
jgi:hypothetical protein